MKYRMLWAGAAAGLAIHFLGLGWDVYRHSSDSTLAQRESVLALSNPSHLMIVVGMAIVAAALLGMAAVWMSDHEVGGAGLSGVMLRGVALPVTIALERPQRWSPERPYLYTAVSQVRRGAEALDRYATPFGVRTLEWGPDKGFLLNGERSRQLGSDLELLQLAFRNGVLHPPDPRMLDAKQYALQTVYVNYTAPAGQVANKQLLLTSPQCRMHPQAGWQKVTLAEFLPTAAPTPAVIARTLKPGDICPVCKAEVRERYLLNSKYVGCLC